MTGEDRPLKRQEDEEEREGQVPVLSSDSLARYIPVPPDGGYGWVVMFASLFLNILVDGIAFTVGIFIPAFIQHFGCSVAEASLVSSVLNGMYLCTGIIAGPLTNRFGCRPVAMAGSVIASIGFILSTFTSSISLLTLTYGVLGGLGFGLMYLPALVSVGFYFEKRRAFATGVATCGAGIGVFIFAQVGTFLLELYDWKSALLILGGLLLNGVVCGALLRPLEPLISGGTSGGSKKETEVTSSEVVMVRRRQSQDLHFSSLAIPRHVTSNVSLAKSQTLLQVKQEGGGMAVIDKKDLSRPMYRQDIFLAASAVSLYRSRPQRVDAVASVTTLPETEPGILGRLCCSGACRDTLNTMLDFSVLKDPRFIFICLGNIFCNGFLYTPFMFLDERAAKIGVGQTSPLQLVSIIGITNTVGRIFMGFIADRPQVNPLVLNNVALVVGGAVIAAMPFCPTFAPMIVTAAVFGVCVAAYISMTSIILCDLLGLERLTNSLGILILVRGISSCLWPPIAGAMYDTTKNYKMTFLVSAAMFALGGVIHCALHLPYFRRRQHKVTARENGVLELDSKI